MSFLESDAEDFCGKDLQKYFLLVAAVAVLVLIGTYWYINYYTLGVDVDLKNAHIDYPGGRGTAPGAVVNPVTANRSSSLAPATNRPVAAALPVARGFSSVAAQLKKSVVNVNVARAGTLEKQAPATAQNAPPKPPGGVRFADPSTGRTVESIGSGVVVRDDGYILTNFHVVQSGAAVYVTVFDDLGTQRYTAEVVKLDEVLDLALLKINPQSRLTSARLGDSNRAQAADPVLTIGSPFGLDQTVSQGVISGTRKSLIIDGVAHNNLLQTDAAINQGNSGGPLVDRNGYVIGINTAIYSPTGAFAGIGFAIPANDAIQFLRDEIDLRAATGAPGPRRATRPANRRIAAAPAAPLIARGAASPHADGREQMDCAACHQILGTRQAAGRPVAGMAFATPGTGRQGSTAAPVPAQAGPPIAAGAPPPHRDGREAMACAQCHQIQNANAAVAFQYAGPPPGLGMNVAITDARFASDGPRVLGATVLPIDQLLSERLGQPAGKGVFVSAVVPGSPMDESGVRAGDVLLKLEGRRLRSPRQLVRRMGEFVNGDKVRLGVLHDGRRRNLKVEVLAMSLPGMTAAPQPQAAPKELNWRGMEMMTIAPANPNAAGASGALVEEVTPGSRASAAGIRNNDVILMIDMAPVDTAARLNRAVLAAGQAQPVWLKIRRGGRDLFVRLG